MSMELQYLAWVCALTALMWIPYILNMIQVRGLADAVGYPADPKPLAPWAARLKAAHYNAVENLVVFAPLVIIVQLGGFNSQATALACGVFFWARLVHAVVYTLAVPWLRTLSFAVAFFSLLVLLWQVLA